MTQYLSKLARRLAGLYAVVVTAACSEAAPRDFLGPDPTTPPPAGTLASFHIAPQSGAIAANQPLQFRGWGRTVAGDSLAVAISWTATGGQIGPDGVFRSAAAGSFTVQGFVVGKPHLTASATVIVSAPASIFSSVAVSPNPAVVPMGGTLQFGAQATLVSGGTTPPSVTWTATGGSISPSGLFTAGMAPGTYQVTAATLDGAHTESVPVTVAAASLTGLQVHPAALTLSPGDQVDFAVQGAWNDGSTAAPAVEWSAQGGSVTASGRYAAGTSPGVYQVVARHVPSGRADTALVTINPGVARIEVTPATATLQPGAELAFSALAVRTDGASVPVAVSWQATGGAMAGSVYSAGVATGQYRVIARYMGGVLADTALVTIALPAATLTGLAITPPTASVGTGGQVRFAAVPSWSDGSSALPALAWSATGGSVAGDGTWTAPLVAGSYQVVVRHAATGLADTATVTVTEAPRVTAVTITPQSPGVQAGGTIQFNAQATWSDGVSRPVEWLWDATGGTISVNGLYSAGSLAGQFLVIASCVGCAASDTTGVSVSAPPPPAATLLSLTLSPAQAHLDPGDVLPMHLSAGWSDGSTQVPDIAWTVQGGTRTGLQYTAGNTPGTYLVVARQAAGSLADTLVVTIAGPTAQEPALTSLVLNPSSVTMNPGEQRTLTLAATWSDGSTTVPPVTWDATGGTLSGLTYTAGSTAGSYRIIVRHQGGTRADTTAVTITAAAPTLQSLTITPNPATVPAGYSVAFSVTGSMSDGSTTTPTVAWTATGGTISSSGVFTASTAAGSFQVTATNAPSGLSAQAAVTVTAPGDWVVNQPELPRDSVNLTYPVMTGKVISVASGGNLQTAINGADCGDEIHLAPGATYAGSFTLPKKNCDGWIVIRTAGPLPPERVRVTPQTASGFARIMATSNNSPAIRTVFGSAKYRIVAVEVSVEPSVTSMSAIVSVSAHGAQSFADIPRDIIFDRVYVHSRSDLGVQRCILLDGIHSAVVDSYVSQCHIKGFDSQAVLVYASPGPVSIVNNYLEGAGENVMLGGASPSVHGVIPSDIIIRGNHFYKPVSWTGLWTIKNLFEIKNGQRVLIEGNLFENNWKDAQTGTAIVIKASNSGGAATWTTASDVTFRFNTVRNAPSGFNLAADPSSNPVVPAARIKFEQNVWENIGAFNGTTGSYWGTIQGTKSGLKDVQIIKNTAIASVSTSLVVFDGSRESERLVILDNHVNLGRYGILGSGSTGGRGTAGLNAYWRSWDMRGNILVRAHDTTNDAYPSENHIVEAGASVTGIMGVLGLAPGAQSTIVGHWAEGALSGNRQY